VIRLATAADAPRLFDLMRKLAAFEGYAERFAVTVKELHERGFATEQPKEFVAWIAERDGEPSGYAVAYVVPFTFDLRPTVVVKELFVEACARGDGCGSRLFAAIARFARSIDARLLRWQVLPDNVAAKRFYARVGGRADAAWESWVLDLDEARS